MTLDNLMKVFSTAKTDKAMELKHAGDVHRILQSERAGVTAVVRALRDESAKGHYTARQLLEDILGDATTREDVGISTAGGDMTASAELSTSPASFCEWSADSYEGELSFDAACEGKWRAGIKGAPQKNGFDFCPGCGKPIKFIPGNDVKTGGEENDGHFSKGISAVGTRRTGSSEHNKGQSDSALYRNREDEADERAVFSNDKIGRVRNVGCEGRDRLESLADASTRKDEGLSGSSVRQPAPTQATTSTATEDESVATVDEDVLIEFVRDWDYSGYHYDLNFARKLKQELLEVGYKILPREPTEEMVDTISYSPSTRILVKQDWRKMWDAAVGFERRTENSCSQRGR